jgi:hypothetical protein
VAHGHTQGQRGLGRWRREVGKVGSDPCHNLLTSASTGCLPGNQRSPGGLAVLGRVLAVDELIALRLELPECCLEVFERPAGLALLRVRLAEDVLISCGHPDRIRGVDDFLLLCHFREDVGNLLVQLTQRVVIRWARHRS